MELPVKILNRKDEITADFLKLAEAHIADLMRRKADRRFSATDFARLLFIHPRHLTNTLKLTTGKSPCDYMEERIWQEAGKLLLETELSVSEIAARFAYDESTNFIKFFKSMCGTTPLRYRKSHAGTAPEI